MILPTSTNSICEMDFQRVTELRSDLPGYRSNWPLKRTQLLQRTMAGQEIVGLRRLSGASFRSQRSDYGSQEYGSRELQPRTKPCAVPVLARLHHGPMGGSAGDCS